MTVRRRKQGAWVATPLLSFGAPRRSAKSITAISTERRTCESALNELLAARGVVRVHRDLPMASRNPRRTRALAVRAAPPCRRNGTRHVSGWLSFRRTNTRTASIIASIALLTTACASGTASPATTSRAEFDKASAGVRPTGSVSASASPVDGEFEVNGRRVAMRCTGSGQPTFVIELGEGMSTNDFATFRTELATRGTACAYRRAAADGAPRDGEAIAADLHALLEAAGIARPVVLVGHSAGGMFVQLHARLYPDDVMAVLAMNPVPPWGPWSTKGFAAMTDAEQDAETAYYSGENGESLDYRATSAQIDGAPPPTDIPMRMLLSTIVQCEGVGICERTYPAAEEIMRDVTAAWPYGSFVRVEAGHVIYRDDPSAVLELIDDLVEAAGQ